MAYVPSKAGAWGSPHRGVATFEGLRMVKGNPVGIFCRKKKAVFCGTVGRSLRHSARPVATCQRFLTPYFLFVQIAKILENLLTIAEKCVTIES